MRGRDQDNYLFESKKEYWVSENCGNLGKDRKYNISRNPSCFFSEYLFVCTFLQQHQPYIDTTTFIQLLISKICKIALQRFPRCSEIPKGLMASSSDHLIRLRLYVWNLLILIYFGSLNRVCAPKLAFLSAWTITCHEWDANHQEEKKNYWISELWVFRFHIFGLCRVLYYYFFFQFRSVCRQIRSGLA